MPRALLAELKRDFRRAAPCKAAGKPRRIGGDLRRRDRVSRRPIAAGARDASFPATTPLVYSAPPSERRAPMEIRQALTFDDVMLVPAASGILPGRHRHRYPAHPRNQPRHPADVGGDGHGDRGAPGDRHGAGRRHRRHPPATCRSPRPGRRGPQGQEVRGRASWSTRSPSIPSRPWPTRCGLMADHQHFGHPGGRAQHRASLVGILTNRDVRFATDPRQPVSRADDQGQAGHGARGRRRARRPSGCCISTASRSCWWSTTTTAASA